MKTCIHALAAVLIGAGALALPVHAQSTGGVLTDDQIDSRYDAARKQCDGLSGNDKDVCMQKAKADKESAQAQSKAGKEKAEADREASKERRKADYDVDMKKCDAMSGDAQDKCEADVKKRYGK